MHNNIHTPRGVQFYYPPLVRAFARLGLWDQHMQPRPSWLGRAADWYICRVDYGRSKPLRPVYALYRLACWYVDPTNRW